MPKAASTLLARAAGTAKLKPGTGLQRRPITEHKQPRAERSVNVAPPLGQLLGTHPRLSEIPPDASAQLTHRDPPRPACSTGRRRQPPRRRQLPGRDPVLLGPGPARARSRWTRRWSRRWSCAVCRETSASQTCCAALQTEPAELTGAGGCP